MNADVQEIDHCEVCGSTSLESVLDLGMHPMCDDLVPVGSDRVCAEYPISILYCEHCRTAHQRYQVPKVDLFPQTYHYRSRFTKDVVEGMRMLVERCAQRFGSLEGKLVLDVGCNDGTLLGHFRDQGALTVGIEPTGAHLDARAGGHSVYGDFLSPALADRVVAEHRSPDFIVFTNVFAHIEDLAGVVASLRRLMSPETILVIENHYLGAVLDGNQFDTFYHEHPRTYSLTSFLHIARSLGVELLEVEFPARYGGNIRVFLGPAEQKRSASDVMIADTQQREHAFAERLRAMASNIEQWQSRKGQLIGELVREYGPLRAKAFPGRAAILIKLLGLDADSIAMVHEKPGSMKIGNYVPGTRIPIGSDAELFDSGDADRPVLNLAWHISSEIRAYLLAEGWSGTVIDIVNTSDFA